MTLTIMRLIQWAQMRIGGTVMVRFTTTLLVLLCLGTAKPAAAQSEEVRYYHTDAIGSVRMITDATGQVVARYDPAPFGEEPSNSSPVQDTRRFVSQEHDYETQLGYFVARQYASAIGRFTAVDPGHVGGNIFDSQSWNAYAYARNNPLRFVDPEGTDYEIRIIGGETFTFEGSWADLHLFAAGFNFGSSTWSGDITNALGVKVGTYWWVPARDKFADVMRNPRLDNSVTARLERGELQVYGASPFAPPLGRYVAAGRLFLKTSHYAPRLLAKGLNVAKVEDAVVETVRRLRPAGDVSGRLTVDGVLVEWRAFMRPDGTVNIGTIFPVIRR